MKRNKMLIIIGAGGHGKVLADIAFSMNFWEEICFLDDYSKSDRIQSFKIIGTTLEIDKYRDRADFIIGIGNNKKREEIFNKLKKFDLSLATLIHPKATIGLDVQISEGTVIMAGVVINISTKLGKGVIVNTNSSIDHDCILGDFVHVSPGVNIAGNVIIGDRSWLGLGCSVINNLMIYKDVVIGAGALVIRDVSRSGIFKGVPITTL